MLSLKKNIDYVFCELQRSDYGPIESVVSYKGDDLCHILIQRVPCMFYYCFPSNYLNEYEK